MLHSRPTLAFKFLIPRLPILYPLPLHPHHRPLLLAVLLHFLPPLPPDSLRVLQWNARSLRARSTELLHFLSSHPVDLILSRNPILTHLPFSEFSALRSDHTHSRSGILSPDATHASNGVIIFIRQGLSFSELSTSTLSSLDPYSDYVGVNISLNNSSSLSFLNVYAPPPICSSLTDGRTDSFSPSILSSQKSLHSGGLQLPSPPLGLKRYIRPPRGGSIRLGHLLLNDPDIPTLLHCFSLDISFAPSSLALPCSWEVLQDLGSDHLPILLSIPLSPVFCPNELPSTFKKHAGMTLFPTLTPTVLLQRNTRLLLFPLQLLSSPLWR